MGQIQLISTTRLKHSPMDDLSHHLQSIDVNSIPDASCREYFYTYISPWIWPFVSPNASKQIHTLILGYDKRTATTIYVADPVWRLWHHFLGSTLQNKQNWIWSMLVWKPLEFRLVALHHRPLPNHLGTRIYLKKTLGGGYSSMSGLPQAKVSKKLRCRWFSWWEQTISCFSLQRTFSLRIWNQIHLE